MTTIVGLAIKEKPAVILASDLAGTSTHSKDEGHVTIRFQSQAAYKKLYVAADNKVVLGVAGHSDDLLAYLIKKTIEGKIDFDKIVADKAFPHLRDINLERCNGRFLTDSKSNSMLLAYQSKDGPKLYTCFPAGLVEEREWTAIGSGHEYAIEHVRASLSQNSFPIDLTKQTNINIPQGIEIACGAIKTASADIYTKGLDFVVMTQEGVKEHGSRLYEALDKAERDALSGILKEYS